VKSSAAALAAVLFTSGSWAALGGAPANFGAQPNSRKSSVLTTGAAGYTVVRHELDSGTSVREYLDATGKVFAVSWSGPFLPDLRELLGTHFEAMQAQAGQREPHSRLSVRRSDVVIVSTGRMGAFEGRAWLPASLPSGFNASGAKWPG
jgi:hypothetical protein